MGKPTECVRAMLDEFGIHWWAGESEDQTRWKSRGLTWNFEEVAELAFLWACEQDVTPEQAIAATVGNARISGIATREQEAIVCDFLRKINPDRDWAYLGEVEHAWISSMVNAIAATVGGEANVRGD